MNLSPTPMHIPDGFLALWLAILGWILALILISVALRVTRGQLRERQTPVMGLLAAFVFAAQAINFPVAAGTSGHLLGGALTAIVLGPWAATLVMTAVIALQGFLFQDGGLLVMGWNILNMGVLTAFSGYAVYSALRRIGGDSRIGKLLPAFLAAWVSVEVGAVATAIELSLSGTSPLRLALPAMAGVHALIGLGEALITVGALRLLQASRPELLKGGALAPGQRSATTIALGLGLALVIAALSPLASTSPDGLEAVAGAQGFLDRALGPLYQILPDYSVPFIAHPALTTIAAVGVGTLLVFALVWGLGRSLGRPSRAGK